MLDTLDLYYQNSTPITLAVLALLALYFITINWIFFSKSITLGRWSSKESSSLEQLLMGAKSIASSSYLHSFVKSSTALTPSIFELALFAGTKESTKGLSTLSIVASTSPFIGLFGTVVSILETFSDIGKSSGTMAVIAAGVSDALIATAAGIFVAIFAYSYHQILKRKAYELTGLLKMQRDAVLSRETSGG